MTMTASATSTDLELELLDREHCRRHLEPFVARMQRISGEFDPGWHITLMCEAAERMEKAIVAAGKRENRDDPYWQEQYAKDLRLIAELPPRHCKSHTFSKCFALWFISRNPSLEVIVAGYGQDFIQEFGDWVKGTLKLDEYQSVFPDVGWRDDSKSKIRMLTKKNGGLRYQGVGSGITGKGAHLFIVDDPVKNAEKADSEVDTEKLWTWFWTVATTRLAPGGGMIVMHTRWRTNDLIGRILKMQLEQGKETYYRINLPAIATQDDYHPITGKLLRRKGEALHPARYNTFWFEELQLGMPPSEFLALYQQNPVAEEGNFFKKDTIQLYDISDLPPLKSLYCYLTTDLAVSTKETADFSAIWAYGIDQHKNVWWMPDFYHAKTDSGETIQSLVQMAIDYDVMNIQFEKGVIDNAVGPLLRMEMDRRAKWFSIERKAVTRDKRTRAKTAQGMMKMGKMYFPNTQRFKLMALPEILAFDKGDHDDLVDCISLAAQCIESTIAPAPAGIPENGTLEPNPEDDDDDWYNEDTTPSESRYSMYG